MNKDINTPIGADSQLSSSDLAMQQAMLDMGAEFDIINIET
jgi:hypothetical protein